MVTHLISLFKFSLYSSQKKYNSWGKKKCLECFSCKDQQKTAHLSSLFVVILIGWGFIFLNKDIDYLHKAYLISLIEGPKISLKVLITSTTPFDQDFLGGMVVLSVKKTTQNFSVQDRFGCKNRISILGWNVCAKHLLLPLSCFILLSAHIPPTQKHCYGGLWGKYPSILAIC